MKRKTWRFIHRLIGLFVVIFLGFYAFSGVLLNHRKYFNHFMTITTENRQVVVDPLLLSNFVSQCQQIVGRDQAPETIFIRDNTTIEIRYGRHDPVLYRIVPATATLAIDSRTYQQPWHGMKWLHVAYQTSPAWVWITDAVGVLMLLMCLSGLFCFRYRKLDRIIVAISLALFGILVMIG